MGPSVHWELTLQPRAGGLRCHWFQENWKLYQEPEPNSYLSMFHAHGSLRDTRRPRSLNPGSYFGFGGHMKIPQLCCLAYTFVQQEDVFLILDVNLQSLQVFSTWASEWVSHGFTSLPCLLLSEWLEASPVLSLSHLSFLICKIHIIPCTSRLPRWRSGKEPACQCRRYRRYELDRWLVMIPWRRNRQPTRVFLAGKFHGLRSLAGRQSMGLQKVEAWLRDWACMHAPCTLGYVTRI